MTVGELITELQKLDRDAVITVSLGYSNLEVGGVFNRQSPVGLIELINTVDRNEVLERMAKLNGELKALKTLLNSVRARERVRGNRRKKAKNGGDVLPPS